MKIQDCPLCGSKASEYNTRNPHIPFKYGCSSEVCELGHMEEYASLETWNRIRISPDGEEFNLTELDIQGKALLDYSGDDYIIFQEWMNPRHPDEKKEGSD